MRWSAWTGAEAGLEHLDLGRSADGIIASAVVFGVDGPVRFGLRYRLVIDDLWRVRDARLETTAGQRLHLESDGKGRWRLDGHAAPGLDDCIDIDIEATPFTNTLPIRRLDLADGQTELIRLAYIRVPSLSVAPGRQRYTAMKAGTRYRFESLDHDFSANLPVDQQGLVRDYPSLFRRLA
nr:putative glycolipid-binding domain-containing protein [Microvirga antarctica]